MATAGDVELSVVLPCLDEAETVARCVETAKRALERTGVSGEVVVADNGSRDGSAELAARAGARVVCVPERGYGSALMGGIAASRGHFVVMGDTDASYDFGEIPKFLDALRAGNELVMGCRLPAGGGRVVPGAMPLMHRLFGNPVFTWLGRLMFKAPVHDVYCGLRGFTRGLYERLGLRCTGMEFATEMVIKASLQGARVAEVPITLYPDGRSAHRPHLKTFRDGWRTLSFFLMCSPRWLYLIPGVGLVLGGLAGYAVALPAVHLGNAVFDAHTLLFASLAILTGYQAMMFAVFAKTFATSEGILPPDQSFQRAFRLLNLERGLLAGCAALAAGIALLGATVFRWWEAGFGRLDYASTMRIVVPGVTLAAIGIQTLWSSFFVAILRMRRR
ncbi:MAG TPA: glycosyltransferase family 2 protein [Verrucomicrobiae bacterium]|nr:glycosyltransferase family 2 protein [Verrucomicrobiae bacterium]